MILPIGHDQSIRRWPYVTIGIIAVCTLVQLYSSFFAPGFEYAQRLLDAGDHRHALAILDQIPMWRWGYRTDSGYNLNMVTCAFVHGGWLHLIGNMIFLWLAGSAIEDRFGPIKFAVFYLAGAAAATICYAAMYSGEPTIVIGASGAVSAVMGAFLVYFATTQIQFWYWWFVRTGTFRAAAYIALPLWFGEQILYRSLESTTSYSGVAYEAHIGGFAFGVCVALVARLLFRENAAADASEAQLPSDDRFDRCMAAIRRGDLATSRTLASRVILDLARIGDNQRLLDVYLAQRSLPERPLTDGAFAAAARAAEAIGNPELHAEIVAELKATHPGSPLARQM